MPSWRTMRRPFHAMLVAGLLPVSAGFAQSATPAPVAAQPPSAWPWAKYGLPESQTPTCVPLKRTDWADSYHTNMLVREKRKELQVVFLGDSITMMWRTQSGFEGGTPVWEKHYAPLNTGNFGISGDTTENILWRITEGGDLDGLQPKALVLLIGINNLLRGRSSAEVADGITTTVNYLKVKLPETKILLLGVFPCWEKPQDPARAKVRETNAIIAKLEDLKQVFYLDMGGRFLEPDGTIRKEKLRDLLHLSEIGYGIWAEAMDPYLDDLLKTGGKGELWSQRINGAPPPPAVETQNQ